MGHLGISMALGAFLAGMVISESDYTSQIIADVTPLRDAFNSLFFVSMGCWSTRACGWSDPC